ncbi:MAG: hypothetical protein ACYDCC_04235 [Actinomycetota bacterium]
MSPTRSACVIVLMLSFFEPVGARAADACTIESISLSFGGYIVTSPTQAPLLLQGNVNAQCGASGSFQGTLDGRVDLAATCFRATFAATLKGATGSFGVTGEFSTYSVAAAGVGGGFSALTDPVRASFEMERCATDGVDRIDYSLAAPAPAGSLPVGILVKAS